MRAILISVDYADLLEVTLPYNCHHFEEVMVVTSSQDQDTQVTAHRYGAEVFVTDSFYEPPAVFNKWKALEEGLDAFGRHGLLCLMDADVLWPKELPEMEYAWNYLYTPLRRMWRDPKLPILPEHQWSRLPIHRNLAEWAGYTQIFHGTDLHLPNPPWHQINWRHAGGADSFFQQLWRPENKLRPPWEVLHLGDAGRNWCGRATPLLNGSRPPEADARLERVRAFVRGRAGGGEDRFRGETY